MKYLLTFAVAAACSLASASSGVAQDVRIQAGSQGFRIGNPNQFSNYGSDSYGRRLNRYQNNYGYRNNGYYNDGHHNDGHHNDGHHNDGHHNDGYHNDGYHNDGYHNDGYHNDGYSHSGQYGYRNYDYYRGNSGRVHDYRDYYRSNPYRGYNNGYYSRPGFSIGGGSSRVYFGF